MRRKIYISLVTLGFACMAVTIVISSWLFWRTMRQQAAEEMQVTLDVIAQSIQHTDHPDEYFQNIAAERNGTMRITWINSDGTIRFESSYQGQMENHLARPEVQEAVETGYGSAIRDSSTLSRALYYMAEKLPDGTILRISMERDTMYAHFLSLLPMVIVLLLLAALGCMKASRMLTASLLNPLRQTALLMRQLRDPDRIEQQEQIAVDPELRPLVDKIIAQSKMIKDTIYRLEQQRNIIRMMMENLQEGVIFTDDTYRILELNQCARTILHGKEGYSYLGQALEPLLQEASWQQIHAHKHSDTVFEEKISRDHLLYQITVQSVYKEDEFYGVLFIIDDITEQEHREQLRREFTSNVSHELKTPLTSISGFAEVLSAGLFQTNDDVVHFGTLIRKESKRLLGMIEEIMHLARIEEHREKGENEPVSLKEIVTDIVEFMEPVLIEKKVTIHCTMEDILLTGNKGLLREMVMNLIDNAVKYNLPGGHVYVSLYQKDKYIYFVVQDTGIGIPEDKQKRVFERFYRADSSRSKKINGSGLGLSIVKHIAERHHGTITLKSKENTGTTITVQLPTGKKDV